MSLRNNHNDLMTLVLTDVKRDCLYSGNSARV